MTKPIAVIEAQGVLEKEYGEQLRQQILETANQEITGILLDLSQVSFMNSTGLGILASIYTTLKKQGKEFFLCSLNEQLKIIFELTSMDSCFKIYPDREAFDQAISSLDN
ncbi:MAG: STAS domain-containing protein [Snowella sp.]|nr:STAS domain-containing protein [Snowella sp.]